MIPLDFADAFTALTGNTPFPWQQQLYQDYFAQGEIPPSCNLPTGLGKTSVIAIWLIALANGARVPRRLVYVVNRRTVVDQSTAETEKIRDRLAHASPGSVLAHMAANLRSLAADPSDEPLAISTLRGQFADNGQWRADPARPAVVVGTVDMIGSRLLFSGYGLGFKTRPLHAGFLGQDSLIVHDEAHLEPAFQELLESIVKEQTTGRTKDKWPLEVMPLTATPRAIRTASESCPDAAERKEPLELTREEKEPPERLPDPPTEPIHFVWRRLTAKKSISFHAPEGEREKVADRIGKLAKECGERNPGSAILVFVNSLADHAAVTKALNGENVQSLTGTMRGFERDRMADPRREDACSIFARFLKQPSPDAGESDRWRIEPQKGTVYLVCTSAGEVGVDISADHMVCDLVPFERMAQRFGRVNRFGNGDATIRAVCESPPDLKKESDPHDRARWKTLELLRQLPCLGTDAYSASPLALLELRGREDLRAAFETALTPEPRILPATDILFDAWALTSIRDKLPGRPPVEPYLHGVPEDDWEPPETHVAWREEVEYISGDLLATYKPADLLDDYPLKPHELLRDASYRVFAQLALLAADPKPSTKDREAAITRATGNRRLPVWIVEPYGTIRVTTLGKLVEDGKEPLFGCTVLLPPSVGGLRDGMLSGESNHATDVADEWRDDKGQQRRIRVIRVWDIDRQCDTKVAGMRLLRSIEFRQDEDGEEDDLEPRSWLWYERPKDADGEGSKSASDPVTWQDHTDDVAARAAAIVARLSLDADLRESVCWAAVWHDLGKQRLLWQRSIGNPCPEEWLAKSGGKMKPREMTDYRHEFGSLLDVLDKSKPHFAQWQKFDENMRDLVLHVLAAGHGWARPHFSTEGAFDPESPQNRWSEASREVPQRYARLQRKYGRWGLAYIESLVRAADYAASATPHRPTKRNSGE